MDRDSQMKAIEKTFEDNKKPVEKHYSKPNVHAVETLSFFPDFKVWNTILVIKHWFNRYSLRNAVKVKLFMLFHKDKNILDFQNWKYPCAQVIFDSDPAPMGRPVPAQIEEMSQAMIRYFFGCL